ncbi:uncharacterized protein [Nicotiana sylvestris]|uniref:uncharacterized protein n=1 Tax=Nicotiana sylvestris TaxID=4096 RepID=UPI00388CAEAD
MGHSPSLQSFSEETMNEARALRDTDLSRVPSEEDPFRNYFTWVDDVVDLNDASTLFEEAQRLFSQAITKLKAELSQCEAELKKSSDEEKTPRILCSQKEEELKDLQTNLLQQKLEMIGQLRGEVDQVKADCNGWKESMDRLVVDKEVALAQLALAETQLQGAKVKNLAQDKKIEELEAKLAKVEAEVAEARAEVERTKVTADKTIVVYLRDVEAIQAKLSEASDREKWSNDLAKCQSQSETLEEIHARGFDLIEEIYQAKAMETDVRFLVSSDDEDSANGFEDR